MTIESERLLSELIGEDSLRSFETRELILDIRREKLLEMSELTRQAADAFSVNLTLPDILVSVSAGVLLGLANGLFKTWVPDSGRFRLGVDRSYASRLLRFTLLAPISSKRSLTAESRAGSQ